MRSRCSQRDVAFRPLLRVARHAAFWVVTGAALFCSVIAEARPPAAATKTPPAPTQNAKLVEDVAALRAALAEEGERTRALSTTLAEVQDTVSRLAHRVGELEAEVRQLREQHHNLQEQVRELREEVRGLYVESSGLKGDIAQVADKIDGLTDSLANFRLSAGMIAALVILLEIIAAALILRSSSR